MEFRDLKAQYKRYKNQIDEAVENVMLNADFIGGKEVAVLEKRLADYVGVNHCITCANGTDALTLVLTAWGIKEGDAVFVPDFTFFASGEAVSYEGATPIFVEVDEDTFNIDVADLEFKIKTVLKENELKPRAIIPVDLYGLPANYPDIIEVAKKYNLLILEDAAQGFGGSINGKKAGSFGDAAITSFFPSKPLGCYGDGGAIFTNDAKIDSLIRSIKFHGKGDNKYNNIRIGMNSRLDTIQAAILNVKLDAFIDHELDDIIKVASQYNGLLERYAKIPVIPKGFVSSYAQYTLTLKSNEEREFVKNELTKNNIPTMIYYPIPMHKQIAFYYNRGEVFRTESLCERVLSIPIHPYLTKDEITQISNVIITALEIIESDHSNK